MPFCAHCGGTLPGEARFCATCGAANVAVAESDLTLDRPSSSSGSAASSVLQSRGSSSSLRAESGRILPGTLLADRYRIVALVGRGGMGEVYRAEDLKLDQDVALKFLPEKLVQDGAALARFHREVRTARDISHPNVCRVFDIGEANGVPFISMEYVQGEDLSTLLRRIGRLPQDKAIDIARQLCAGLAVAHDHSVLHRDLKPANVMLDDRGKVRIMDFGLAGAASEIQGAEVSSGTPAYMAPEQLEGREVSVQSDIYSLGLVLYEVFTGKRAFEGATLGELVRMREQSSVTNPSDLVRDLDPLVVRVILRCLEPKPERRPRTALQISAALPGGDPLAAALAAGETPSPQMVAASGGEQALEPKLAWTYLSVFLVAFIAILAIARYSTDLGLYPIEKSRDVLEDRAREVAQQAGYTRVADHASWFDRNYAYLLWRNAMRIPAPHPGDPITGINPGALDFNYRQSPELLKPLDNASRVTWLDPPYETSEMVLVSLDSIGRLRVFRAVPLQDNKSASAAEPNWDTMFQQAGLDFPRFQPVSPTWLPNEPFDVRREWQGTYPGDSTPVRVSAASYQGRPVYFRVISPWVTTSEWGNQQLSSSTGDVATLTVVAGGLITVLLAVVFARKNIRGGRGDRKGAMLVASFYFVVSAAGRLLSGHHVPNFTTEFNLDADPTAIALFVAALIWFFYIALEPYVRSKWPQYLVSWTRLLGGGFRDAMVGRDLLAGCAIGAALALSEHILNALPAWFHLAGQTPINADGSMLGSTMSFIGILLKLSVGNLFTGLTLVFLLFFLRTVIPNYWAAITALGVLITLVNLGRENVVAETIVAVIIAVLTLIALLRFGLLTVIVACTAQSFLQAFPVALNLSRWYFARGFVPALIVLVAAIYGFRQSLGARPVFPALAD